MLVNSTCNISKIVALARWTLLPLAFRDCYSARETNFLLLTPDLLHTQVLGSFGCRSAGFLQTFAILFNSSTLIAISVDRYRCVVQARSQPFMPEWRSAHTAIYVLGVSALCLGKAYFARPSHNSLHALVFVFRCRFAFVTSACYYVQSSFISYHCFGH